MNITGRLPIMKVNQIKAAAKAAAIAVPMALGLTLTLSLTSASQAQEPEKKGPPAPRVYVNPRSGADDPRVGLKAGLYDAGIAQSGLELITSIPKPSGFVAEDFVHTPEMPKAPNEETPKEPPALNYGSTNSDLAFSGNHIFVGNYNGINFYDIDNPGKVKLRASIMCPGGQGDVSVYKNLLFMSVEAVNGRVDCGTQGVPVPTGYVPPPLPPAPAVKPGEEPIRPQRALPPPSPDRFRGVRIFDISDLGHPKQVAAVQSCRGSHTHTLVLDPKDKENVFVYISGTAQVRQGDELAGCSGGSPEENPNTALFRIDIIKVPIAHPELAKIVAQPRIFADPKTGKIDSLWKRGFHGEGTQTSSETDRCHDITVYSSMGLAAGACSGNGILLDISNPVNPVRIDAVTDENYAFWHSANFNNAGTKVLFTDEWGGGSQPRCRATDPMSWGADAIFTLKDRKLTLASYFKMPAPQTELENCVAHNGALLPVPGRDILVQSWYQGGISLVDFTDATHPVEIGYFDRGPLDATRKSMGGHWSTYWYNGYIYSSEIARGVDVLQLVPSKYLSKNEIDAAKLVHFDELNVQNQPKYTWPNSWVVARAYLDQLARGTTVPAAQIEAMNIAITSLEASRTDRKSIATLKAAAAKLEKDAGSVKNAEEASRMKALAALLKMSGSANL
jgi:hypothetical protein